MLFPLVLATIVVAAGALGGLRWWTIAPLPAAVLAALAAAGFLLIPARGARWAALAAFLLTGLALGAAARERVATDCRMRLPEGASIDAHGVLAANVSPLSSRREALILTHPDADHIGGAPAVLKGIPVGRLVEPGMAVGKPLYLETLRAADSLDVIWAAARAGTALGLDGVEIEVLAPDSGMVETADEANDGSAVLLLRYGRFDALLPGDLPAVGEARLVSRYGPALQVEVLKAGHHGSRTSTSEALLAEARPELAVVSAGRRNQFGHPAPEVLARLRRRGIPVARTDREGTISLRARTDGRWERIRP